MLKKSLIVPLMLLIAMTAPARAVDVFMEPDVFLSEVFGTQAPEPSFLWLKGDLKAEMQEILGRKPGGLRMRYWQDSERTVWILEEIGKTQPITTGISIKASAIERVQVLIYRESHGWEVRYPFFTDQFRGMTLEEDRTLSRQVDGISGATLSVRALTKLARLALRLDAIVREET
ncbi:FMN-binding domain protein [Rhodobiaceae bacterium]|nr:FMN-binding domain protein [Rhodobiaceae bacterium]